MYQRIIVTGDILRPHADGQGGWESATWRNIRWLRALISPGLQAGGCEVLSLAWDDMLGPADGQYFDAPAVYARLGQRIGMEEWSVIAAGPLPPSARDAVLAACTDALVVGYEMPPGLISLLSEAGVPFIDVMLHPLHFLDDLVFALRSNVPALHRLFLHHRLDAQEAAFRAGQIRAKAAWMRKPAALPPGSALVLGQVASDRALWRHSGGFYSLADFAGSLHALCCGHAKVLFKPHPYDSGSSPSQQAIRRLPAVEWTQANIYHLLAQPEIETVVALNSSGLVEAAFFDKAIQPLIPGIHDFGIAAPAGSGSPGQAVPQDGNWADPAFWLAVLHQHEQSAPRFAPAPNRLRRSMNADWGYGAIDKVVA